MRRLSRITYILCGVICTVLLGFFWRGTAQPGPAQSASQAASSQAGSTVTQRPKKPAEVEWEQRMAELPVVDFTEFDPVATTDPKRAARNRRHNTGIST